MKNAKTMQEEGRGSHDFRTADDVMLVRWADNSVVTAATNFENLTIVTANRWSKYHNPLCSHRTTKVWEELMLWIKMWQPTEQECTEETGGG